MSGLYLISPSKTAFYLKEEIKQKSLLELQKHFNPIIFSKHFFEKPCNGFSSSIEDRVADLHAAYQQQSADTVMAYSGGFNCNQLLDYIDWEILNQNPKHLCGMSDITVLLNAVYAKTKQITFLSPVFTQFATFGLNKHDFSYQYFLAMLKQKKVVIPHSLLHSDDRWQTIRSREDICYFNIKDFSGTLIGGNLSSFALLCGTPYFPKNDKTVLLLEEDDHVRSMPSGNGPDFFFERQLTQLTQMSFFQTVQAILIGRFKKESFMNKEKVSKFIENNPKLRNLPLIYGLDFGHTNPVLTFPIGGKCYFSAKTKELEIFC